jgi:hypothetical protein
MVKLFALLSLFFLLSACDLAPYELKQSNSGEIIIVNKWTGNAQKVFGDKIVELDKITSDDKNKSLVPRGFSDQEIKIHNIKINLSTIFRNETIFYELKLKRTDIDQNAENKETGFEKTLKENRNKSIQINFSDSFGFIIKEIVVPLSNVIRIIDENEKISFYEAKGSVKLAYDDYKYIKDWTVSWNF